MIENLRIENLGVITEAELTFPDNLIALTGETGAGKTMAVTSLQLLLGAKADPSKVRHGAEAARVEGTFVVPADSPVLSQIDDVGGVYDAEGDQAIILIARHIPVNGRSRAFIGGKAVPVSILNDIAAQLVTVHGQMDQIRLVSPSQQRTALDTFAGVECHVQREKYADAYRRYHEAQAALDDFANRSKEGARERLALEAFLAKIDEIAPEEGEEERLREETQRLEEAQERYLAYDSASAYLLGSDETEGDALSAIAAAVRQLENLAGRDASDTDLRDRLEAAEKEIADIAQTLNERSRDTYLDPEHLSELYARRQALQGLRKELGMGLDEALAEAEEARKRLEDVSDPEARREQLEENVRAARETMNKEGAALSQIRHVQAQRLSELVSDELADLALPDARFVVEVSPSEPAAHGMDSVAFLLSSHKEAPLLPLARSASGGELSRIMLALEVALASQNAPEDTTFLFDEVDTGVGGKAGLSIGARLARLGASSQVIVVTHLAQVAAYASTHIRVEKGTQTGITQSSIATVEAEEREKELARMLSGSNSDAARAHAAELLEAVHMA